MSELIINKSWAMPNGKTFSIKPINELIMKHKSGFTVDPFANQNRIADFTNDLDPQYDTNFNIDALLFLQRIETASVDTLLFDPPYSPRQVSECYKNLGMTVNMQTTQSKFWGDMKKEISRIVRPNGKVLTFGWNSGGIGKSNGFRQIEILLVAHGGWHNDTIVTVEVRQ